MEKLSRKNKWTKILLVFYVIILTWIILFKMEVNIKYLPYIRSINLIPFGKSTITNDRIYFKEIIYNLVVFIPVGLYIEMLLKEKKFCKKLFPILLLTLTYEITQYIFHIGATDITDVIMNTLGGILGLVIVNFLYKIFKNNDKIEKVLNILATICTILVVTFIAILIIANL